MKADTVHRVYNVTRQTWLSERTEIAETFWTRLRGLIGHAPLRPGEAMLIRPCKGVHCWFMGFPLDIIFVDPTWRVVSIAHDMQPWAVGRPIKAASFVIEMASGEAKRTQTMVGDQLQAHAA